jgi:hypothetical protein
MSMNSVPSGPISPVRTGLGGDRAEQACGDHRLAQVVHQPASNSSPSLKRASSSTCS